MFDKEADKQINEALWVLAKLKDSVYAINSVNVEAIFLLEQNITPTAENDQVCIGIIPFRDTVIPLLDLRSFMGILPFSEEMQDFEQMLEQRKNDHIVWGEELKRCLCSGDTFQLATDPHQCAFGKWYDNYKPKSHTVAYHLKQIDEPHQKLHATAAIAFKNQREHNEAGVQDVLHNGVDVYVPRVVNLLEDTKAVFRESYHRMVVVVANEKARCGLLVDEVISVEPLALIIKNGQSQVGTCNKSVSHIAQNPNGSDLILIANLDKIFERSILAEQKNAQM